MSRQILLGIGIGLIAGALLVQAMLLGQTPPTASWNGELPSDWMEKAASMGYTITASKEQSSSTAANDADSKDGESQSGEQVDAANAANATEPTVKEVTLYIPEGLKSKEVAILLEKSGVVSDAAVLEKELKKKGLTRTVQIGVYTFAVPTDFETVLKVITRKG